MTKKQVLRCISFLAVVCIVLFVLCDLFEQENGGNTDRCFNTYRALGEDTIDGVFIGTSGVSCYWVSPLAYEEYGMTVYPLAADALPAWLYISMIEEALAYQTPELFLLDIRPFTSGRVSQEKMDANARFVLDAMDPFSVNRYKTGVRTMKTIHAVYEDAPAFDISYFLSFVKYHPKWREDAYRVSYNLGQRMHKYGGFRLDPDFSAVVEPQPEVEYDPAVRSELGDLYEQSLYELLDYIREKDLRVLFVDTPKVLDSQMGSVNRILQILEEEGFDCLTYVDIPEDGSFPLDIDYKTDFFDEGHVNYYGAEKYTRALAAYLDTHYDLPDRRNDPRARADWDGLYQVIQEDLVEIEAETAARGNRVAGDGVPAEE
nr:hypothetical protein [Oscillospiraceae bacterium]